MSARDVETAFALGYADGFHGRALTYADGRRAGTARSGRLPPPRALFFDTPYCRAVLARSVSLAPGLDDVAGRHEAGVPSHDEAP